jgi:catechol 2,3-dioxygenase-like lactoylglutathione lyase family enzyme
MVSIGMVVLSVADMGRAVGFWSQALGYEVREGGAGADWSSLTPAGGLGTGLGLQLSTTVAEKHPRVHLDLYAAGAAEQAAEAERLVSLGAERADWDLYPADPDFVVLADPDGNRFCIVNTSHGHE